MIPVDGPMTPSLPADHTEPSTAGGADHGSCPGCGVGMAGDQRYCIACGRRRREPQPPSVEALTSIGSTRVTDSAGHTPPPPPKREGESRTRRSPNAAMIAGVATLLLAVGLGFLIGRAGHQGDYASVLHGTERITIENAGEGPAASAGATPARHGPESRLRPGANGDRRDHAAATKKAPASKEGRKEEGNAERETREALHAKGPLAKPKAKLGESCKQGTPGCGKDKKFNGEFFGEEE